MINDKLHDLIEQTVTSTGFEFVGCEFQQQPRQSLLRVYVDGENGINLDSCADISRQLASVLDVEDVIKGSYSLEVSSPGLARPLFKIDDYKRFIGKTVKLKSRLPMEGRRNFKGILQAVNDDDAIVVQLEEGELVTLAFDEIDRAKLVPEF
ncbi:MAG: ribosome maturation factor RimP [Gammaproteobacteria bacterium]|nr:ribosome maturation factor RimP [Gammaproteobacteria bacterium]MCH9743670.1 ribosome maturation factor RimP [Gammaproteobacteria bacterium]